MSIGNRRQRQRARIGPLPDILGYQSRLGLNIVEIFDDRQRLEDGMAVVNKGRHHALGVDGGIARFELFADEDVDRNFLERQVFQTKRHPHPK